MHADEQLAPWYRHVFDRLPPVELLDAHTHIGEHDPDGFRCDPQELISALEPVGSRAVVFPMHEPGGYPEANDWVIASAAASGGRLIPFCGVDPGAAAPRRELERCLGAGAKGLKLHPRAEQFSLGAPEVRGLFEVAAEAGVPVLVHAGRGIPALGVDALALAGEFPRVPLILAHAGVCDLSWLAGQTRRHGNLYFDTAWMSPPDLLALFTLVPPGQVLYATDMPYGSPSQTGIMTFRCALQAGLGPAALEAVAGGQLSRLLDGEEPVDLGPAPGPQGRGGDPLLLRVVFYLAWASALTSQGIDAAEMMDLARLACVVDDRAPQADLLRSTTELVDLAAAAPVGEAPQDRFARFQILASAGTLAVTPDVGVPGPG